MSIGQYVNILLSGQALNVPAQLEEQKLFHVVRQRQKSDRPVPKPKLETKVGPAPEPAPKPRVKPSPQAASSGTKRRHKKSAATIRARHADQGYFILSSIEGSLGMKRGQGSLVLQRLGLACPSGRRRMLKPMGEAVGHAHVQTHRLFWDGEWVKGVLRNAG